MEIVEDDSDLLMISTLLGRMETKRRSDETMNVTIATDLMRK